MLTGDWNYPTSVRAGAGRVAELPDACTALSIERPLLVTDPGIAALPLLAESNEPYGFDRIVAYYPDGRAFQWRQINTCGAASFAGDPLPEGCPPAPKKD